MAKADSRRCPSGIPGFDELVEGGFPRNRTILLNGECGTGKTIFATQFLYNGASKYNEPGVLVLLEQNPDEFKEDMAEFNFDLDKMEKDGKITIIDASLSKLGFNNVLDKVPISSKSFSLLPGETTIEKLIDIIIRASQKISAKRAMIDSIPALDIMMTNAQDVRRMILNMNYKLKAAGLTSLVISEISDDIEIPTHGTEKYVVDGVITLRYCTAGPETGRTLVIDKMRRTSHDEDIHTIKFTKGRGIEVVSD